MPPATRRSSRRVLALLALAVLTFSACSSGSDAGTSSTTSSKPGNGTAAAAKLDWKKCENGECATLSVPLDAAAPAGKQISLALARVPTKKPDERIGSVLVNPGGPGAPGADFAQEAASALPSSITDRFDIVGWDPRGTGGSNAVDCGGHLDYLFDADVSPDNATEQTALEAASQRFAQDCQRDSGALLQHIASVDTVRDMDRIREALGEKKLTYAGFSYGTYLGALYAQMFPQNVRALVLDGAIDPAIPVDDVAIQQAKGFEASLASFLDDCAQHSSCTFHHDGKPRAALDALRARIERTPLRADGRTLGPSQFDIALAAPLYAGADGYALLASALHRAERGDPSAMLAIFDDYVGRESGGSYSPEWSAFLAISCADGPPLSLAGAVALEQKAAAVAPYFGASNIGLSLPCAYWPIPAVNATPTPVSAPTAPPIVVVGTTGDPATPVAWAAGLARELGTARLVVVEGTTHTSTLDGNPCVDAAVMKYLVDLHPPRDNLHCGA